MKFNIARPKSSKRKFPTVVPDLDNYVKLILDAWNGLVFADDSQVIEIHAEKVYALVDVGVCATVNRVHEREVE